MVYLWIALMVVFIVVEGLTVQLVSTWFAVGALSALIANLCGAGTGWQIAVFFIVSIICLIITKPLVKKLTSKNIQPTNADRCIGQEAIVIERIDNIAGKGQVNVKGAVWTARSCDGRIVDEGERVKILSIDGVKLIVEPAAVSAVASGSVNN